MLIVFHCIKRAGTSLVADFWDSKLYYMVTSSKTRSHACPRFWQNLLAKKIAIDLSHYLITHICSVCSILLISVSIYAYAFFDSRAWLCSTGLINVPSHPCHLRESKMLDMKR